MRNNITNSIVSRLKNINDQYKIPLSDTSINRIKGVLAVPEDFVKLNSICRTDFFGLFTFFNFESEGGIISETLYYRKNHNLPDCYLVLFADDVSFVLLKSKSTAESEVIWCDYQDFFNLCDGKPMEYDPTIFPTFTDFYEFLLDEEEKSRASDNSN